MSKGSACSAASVMQPRKKHKVAYGIGGEITLKEWYEAWWSAWKRITPNEKAHGRETARP